MDNKRFLATGAIVLASDIDLNGPRLEYADVRDFSAIDKKIRDFKPDLIIKLPLFAAKVYSFIVRAVLKTKRVLYETWQHIAYRINPTWID